MRPTQVAAFAFNLISLSPLTFAAPASTPHGPLFSNCSTEKQEFLRITIKDAIDLSALSASVIDTVRLDANGNSKVNSGLPLGPFTAWDLVRRWFGEDTNPMLDSGDENLAYIQGLFNRMHSLLVNNGIMLRCDPADCYIFGTPGIYAFVGNGFDAEHEAVFEFPQASGMNFCSRFWNTIPVWDDVLKDLVRNDTDKNLDTIAVKTLMHEMAYTLQVAQKKAVMDVCLPGYRVKAAGGTISQALAFLDTNLAMHNADNYAWFAIDVALSNWTSTPALHYDPSDNNQKELLRKFDKIESVSSVLSRFEAFSTMTLSAPTPVFDFSKPPSDLEKELATACGKE